MVFPRCPDRGFLSMATRNWLSRLFARAPRPVGKILVAGSTVVAGSTDFAVARFNANGTLDTAFGGGDGIATVDVGGTDVANAVALGEDGTIAVAGTTTTAGNADVAVVRLT